MAYSSYENLEVWRRACELAVSLCRLTESIAQAALRNPMQRAAVSIPSNIAEGSERDSGPDFIRFLRIAKGSSAEPRTQLLIAHRLQYIDEPTYRQIHGEAAQIGAMLQGLIRSIGDRRTLQDGVSPTGPEDDLNA